MTFKETVQEKSKELSIKEVIAFGWRCSVRALPILGAKGNFHYWKEDKRRIYLYKIFRAIDVTCLANKAFDDAADARAAFDNARAAFTEVRAVFDDNGGGIADHDNKAAGAAGSAGAGAGGAAEKLKMQNIILQDLEDTIAKKKPQISIEDYGAVWENFQKALKKENCEYWGKFYQHIFENNFEFDVKEVEKRLNVPEEFRKQGADIVANYLESYRGSA